ncbi:hypothetical protein [Haloarchaeobius sp. DT45]|uniref:hypothetical protein n=1 Tax=Haloarchaeobius sp. DT45 TaxID=3446116 RepID=UPI003F6A78C2
MDGEQSGLYVGRTLEGRFETIVEYAKQHVGLGNNPEIYCPQCYQLHNENQLLEYDGTTNRFIHQNVNRGCLGDGRASRDHQVAQQAVYAKLANGSAYQGTTSEYNLGSNFYDVGATTPDVSGLSGIVVEVQHACGNFRHRIARKVRTAHKENHGIAVVFTPSATGRAWLERRLNKLMKDGYRAGKYDGETVSLGTVIRPGEVQPNLLMRSEEFVSLAD